MTNEKATNVQSQFPVVDANYVLQNVYDVQKVSQKKMYLMITVNLISSDNLLPMANKNILANHSIPKIVSGNSNQEMLYAFQPIDVVTKAPYGESHVVLGNEKDLKEQGYVKFNEHMFYSQLVSSSAIKLKEQVELVDNEGNIKFGYVGDYLIISLEGEFSLCSEKEFKKKFNFEK